MKTTMLKVVSILLIVFGGIAAFGLLTSLLAIRLTVALYGGIYILSLLISVVAVAAELAGGIIGLMALKKPEKLPICWLIGIGLVALQVISLIVSLILMRGYFAGFSVLSTLIGLVLPVLYLIGTNQAMKTQA